MPKSIGLSIFRLVLIVLAFFIGVVPLCTDLIAMRYPETQGEVVKADYSNVTLKLANGTSCTVQQYTVGGFGSPQAVMYGKGSIFTLRANQSGTICAVTSGRKLFEHSVFTAFCALVIWASVKSIRKKAPRQTPKT